MKQFFWCAVLALICSGCACVAAPKWTAEELLGKMEKAHDPKQTGRTIKSFRTAGTSQIANQKLMMETETLFLHPDKFRITVKIKGMPTSVVCFDGEKCFRDDGIMGVTPIRNREKDVTVYLAKLSVPGYSSRTLFDRVELETANGEPALFELNQKKCYKIVCFPPASLELPPFKLYIDAADYFLRRMEFAMVHGASTIPAVADFFDYRDFNGVMAASQSREYYGNIVVESRTKSLEFNVPVSLNAFRPKE